MTVEFIELIIGISALSVLFVVCLIGFGFRIYERGKIKGIEETKEKIDKNALWFGEMYDIKIDERVYRDLQYRGKEYDEIFFVRLDD